MCFGLRVKEKEKANFEHSFLYIVNDFKVVVIGRWQIPTTLDHCASCYHALRVIGQF